MASRRKRWRVTLAPVFVRRMQSSRVAAYRYVDRYRLEHEAGMSRAEVALVEVDEGDGWRLYERVVFRLSADKETGQ